MESNTGQPFELEQNEAPNGAQEDRRFDDYEDDFESDVEDDSEYEINDEASTDDGEESVSSDNEYHNHLLSLNKKPAKSILKKNIKANANESKIKDISSLIRQLTIKRSTIEILFRMAASSI